MFQRWLSLLLALSVMTLVSGRAWADEATGTVVKVDNDKQTLTVKVDDQEYTGSVATDAKITVDGKPAKLTDLKVDQKVKVTYTKAGEKITVTEIAAAKAEQPAAAKPATAPAAKPAARPWANEPAGFTTLTDYSGAVLPFDPESGEKVPQPGAPAGWLRYSGKINQLSIVDDPTAPFSPSKVFQFLYPKGMRAGYGHGMINYKLSTSELYVGIYMKFPPDWQQPDGLVSKLFYIFQQKGTDNRQAFFPCLRGKPGGPYYIGISNEAGDNGKWWTQNKAQIPIQPGRWYKTEWYFKKASAEGADDGVVKWWIDGQLAAEHTGAKTRVEKFSEFHGDPVWGGGSATNKLHDDYLWWDHVYISGK